MEFHFRICVLFSLYTCTIPYTLSRFFSYICRRCRSYSNIRGLKMFHKIYNIIFFPLKYLQLCPPFRSYFCDLILGIRGLRFIFENNFYFHVFPSTNSHFCFNSMRHIRVTKEKVEGSKKRRRKSEKLGFEFL